jgi:type II secretory ATPase GspE/PulE/Tfp pilus assembly ATPase PilB-like protein
MLERRGDSNQEGAAQIIGQEHAFRYVVYPVDLRGDDLLVIAASREGLHDLETLTRKRLVVLETDKADAIRERLRTLYRNGGGFSLSRHEERQETARATLGHLLEAAIAAHSSDVHFEPLEHGTGRVRFRVDRDLREQRTFDREEYQS